MDANTRPGFTELLALRSVSEPLFNRALYLLAGRRSEQ
jgi:hypothetical protein